MASFISLYTAFSGLQAAKAGIDTIANNIANAGTIGYTRQRVNTTTRLPYQGAVGLMGQGVEVVDITRGRQDLLDSRVRSSASTLGQFTTLANLMSSVEIALGEPNTGVTNALNGLWASFDDLTLDPTSSSARQMVVASLGSVVTSVRNVATAWATVANGAERELASYVGDVNQLLGVVADLNKSILATSAQASPSNDLMDRRDLALDRLASLVGSTSTIEDDGSVRVSVNGLHLVSGVYAAKLTLDPSTNTIMHQSGTAISAGGEIAGVQSFLNGEYPAMLANLDAFVTDLADALNTQNAAGFAPTGASGGPLLSFSSGSPSSSVAVAIVDGNDLATAASAGPPFPIHDPTNAAALADLRTTLTANGATQSLDSAMRTIIGNVGSVTSAALDAAESQLALTSTADIARSNAHGVSIDEEMVSLITYQRAYEAAARVMTAVDQALDTLINRTGIVGR